jgi:hypothetical protein
MTHWSIRGNLAKMQSRIQLESARARVLYALSAALFLVGPVASSANAEDITIAQLRGKWQAALLWSSSGCGPMSGLLNFTFGLNGTTSTATLTRSSAGCPTTTTTESFTIQSLILTAAVQPGSPVVQAVAGASISKWPRISKYSISWTSIIRTISSKARP